MYTLCLVEANMSYTMYMKCSYLKKMSGQSVFYVNVLILCEVIMKIIRQNIIASHVYRVFVFDMFCPKCTREQSCLNWLYITILQFIFYMFMNRAFMKGNILLI